MWHRHVSKESLISNAFYIALDLIKCGMYCSLIKIVAFRVILCRQKKGGVKKNVACKKEKGVIRERGSSRTILLKFW